MLQKFQTDKINSLVLETFKIMQDFTTTCLYNIKLALFCVWRITLSLNLHFYYFAALFFNWRKYKCHYTV